MRDIDQELFLPLMSAPSQAALAAAVGGIPGIRKILEREAMPISAVDLMGLVEGIRARARTLEETLDPPAIVAKSLSLDPHYVASNIDRAVRDDLETDAGHLAVAADFSGDWTPGIVSERASWNGESSTVDISAELELWEMEGEVESVPDERSVVKETIPLWLDPDDVYEALGAGYDRLFKFPRVAIEVAYRAFVLPAERDQEPLDYSVGPNFVSSIESVGFANQAGRLATTFRIAAHVACGRTSSLRSLSARPYRTSSGGNAGDHKRTDGVKLMRGNLGTGPDAARLMWWDGSCPEILGVVTHDGDPLDLL